MKTPRSCAAWSLDSASPDFFSERDQRALQAVAGWVELIMHRADLIEQRELEAERRGGRRAAEELAKLTRRQQEVAACIAEGLSNEEIARRLVLTPGTAATTSRASCGDSTCAAARRSA